MAIKQTLALIKPDVTSQGPEKIQSIVDNISARGFSVRAICETQWSPNQAEEFYSSLSSEPFFNDLITFMTSGNVVMLTLSGEEVIDAWKTEMGNVDPALAEPNTLRALHGTSVLHNAFHGSNDDTSAAEELAFFEANFITPNSQ